MTLCLLGCGLLLVLGSGFMRAGGPARPRALALAALAAAALAPGCAPGGELLGADAWSRPWQLLALGGAAAAAWLLRAGDEVPFALLLGSCLGLCALAEARNLLALYLALELAGLPSYALIYALRPTRRGLEGALKYFFVGSAASAVFLLGAAVVYAQTGSLALGPAALGGGLGVGLMGAAALLKLGAFPLHFWLPDAYEAAAPELAGYLSTSAKAGAALLLMRVLVLEPRGAFASALPAVAACTMTVGNLLALRQERLARLLAYSSVAHAGYLLVGIASWAALGAEPAGATPVFVYLAAYLAMNMGAFASLRLWPLAEASHLQGLGRRQPAAAAFLGLMLVSLAGMPPTAGFLAKVLVFWDGLRAGLAGLVVIAALNSVLGLGYYFRLVRLMILEEEGETLSALPAGLPAGRAVLWACAAPTAAAGFLPWVATWAAAVLGR